MAKSLFSGLAAAAFAALAVTPAHAVDTNLMYAFDFLDSTKFVGSTPGYANSGAAYQGGYSGMTVGNSLTFKSTTDAGLWVNVSAYSINRGSTLSSTTAAWNDDKITAAQVGLSAGNGLTVRNIYEDGSSPNHSIDNAPDVYNGATYNMVDFLILRFNYDVDLTGFATGWVQGDQDATVRAGVTPSNAKDQLWTDFTGWKWKDNDSSTKDLTDVLGMKFLDQLSDSGSATPNTSPQTYRPISETNTNPKLDTNANHGMVWLIGALYGNGDANKDYFKLDALSVDPFPTVPEPSTWMTMILGFGFIGATMRRRKTAFGKSTPSAS